MIKNLRSSLCLLALCVVCVSAAVPPPPQTVITGDKMQIIKNGEQVIFTGNARVMRGRDILTADKLIENKADKFVEGFGNINFFTLTADTEPVQCRSGAARYALNLGTGRLWENRPLVTWWTNTSTAPVTMQADVIDFDQQAGLMTGEGAVNIISSSGTVSSPVAYFYQREKKVVLINTSYQPEVTYLQPDSTSRYRADRVEMLMKEKRVVFTGNVRGRVLKKESSQ